MADTYRFTTNAKRVTLQRNSGQTTTPASLHISISSIDHFVFVNIDDVPIWNIDISVDSIVINGVSKGPGNNPYATGAAAETAIVALFNDANSGSGGSGSGGVYDTVAAMQADVANIPTGTQVTTLGYYAKGDGGGGQYYYNKSSSATADGGSVITASTGRFIAIFGNEINAMQFGLGGGNDDTPYILAAITAAGNGQTVIVPKGDYFFATTLNLSSLTKRINFLCYGDIVVSDGIDAVKLSGTNPYTASSFQFYGSISGSSFGGSRATYHNNGIVLNNLAYAHVYVHYITGFNTALLIESTGSSAIGTLYNNIRFDFLSDNTNGINVVVTGHLDNFITQNTFWGGSIQGAVNGVTFVPQVSMTYTFDGNNFINVSMEGMDTHGWRLDNCENTLIQFGRSSLGENGSATDLVTLTSTCKANRYLQTVEKSMIIDNGTYTSFDNLLDTNGFTYSKVLNGDLELKHNKSIILNTADGTRAKLTMIKDENNNLTLSVTAL